MAARLLLVVLLCHFHKIQGQALRPPTLKVNTAVITAADAVVLSCEAPLSVPVSQCYFYIVNGETFKTFSCVQTPRGSELLLMSRQSSPAEVQVRCFYTLQLSGRNNPSKHSDTSSITVQGFRPPKLKVNTAVITETDAVTLHCKAPSSVQVSQCYFYIVNGETFKTFSCRQTLRGSELLLMSRQSSPAEVQEVQVRCFYTRQLGDVNLPSTHSDISSITVQGQKPQMSIHPFEKDFVIFVCTLPESVKHDASCNLYFGESSHHNNNHIYNKPVGTKRNKNNKLYCQFYVNVGDLFRHFRSLHQKDASCDYSLGSEPSSLSPRSDAYSLTAIIEKEPASTTGTSQLTRTTELNVNRPTVSTPTTPVNQTSVPHRKQTTPTFISTAVSLSVPSTTVKVQASTFNIRPAVNVTSAVKTTVTVASGEGITVNTAFHNTRTIRTTTLQTPAEIPKWGFAVAAFGGTVGVIILVLLLLWTKRQTVKSSQNRTETSTRDVSVCMKMTDQGRLPPYEDYSEITSVPAADFPSGSDKLKRQDFEDENVNEADIYHVYATIPDGPTAAAQQELIYSLLQAHTQSER